MGKKFIILLLLLVSACASDKSEIMREELPPMGSNVTIYSTDVAKPISNPLIAKPRPLSSTDRNYTAPYPTLSTATTTVTDPTRVPAVKTVTTSSGKTFTRMEERIVELEVKRGAVSTGEFLGTKKKSIYSKEPVVVEKTTIIGNETVLDKAMRLPPKDIKEGKYRTFRRIEDDMAHDSRKMRGAIAEWLFPEMNDVVEKPKAKYQPESFCYGTFADATCYSKPIVGQEWRRIGKPVTLLEVYPAPPSH